MTQFRYERKYLTEDYLPDQLEGFLKTGASYFKQLYYQRRVWSMYFDTPDKLYYQQNLMGGQRRKKVRVRWYEHDEKLSPVQLEVKMRDGEVLRKEVYKLKQDINKIGLNKLKKHVREWLKLSASEAYDLCPVMVNSYERKYFRTEAHQIRVTIDSDLRFQHIRDFNKKRMVNRLQGTILEAKYKVKNDKWLDRIVQDWPLRISKSSKYMMGVQLCG